MSLTCSNTLKMPFFLSQTNYLGDYCSCTEVVISYKHLYFSAGLYKCNVDWVSVWTRHSCAREQAHLALFPSERLSSPYWATEAVLSNVFGRNLSRQLKTTLCMSYIQKFPFLKIYYLTSKLLY